MFQFFEIEVIILLFMIFSSVFLFALFLTMLPRTNEKHQTSTDTSMKVVKENGSECTMLGFLDKLPKGDPIPRECMTCSKLVECVMAKRAFNWYVGQKSAQNSKNERINGTETPKHIQQ